jgi:hypothetical protein
LFFTSWARETMYASSAALSEALSLPPNDIIPCSRRAPCSTIWSKPACECRNGVVVRFGALLPRPPGVAFGPWHTEQLSAYSLLPRAMTSGAAVSDGGFSGRGVNGALAGSFAVPPTLNTSMRP